MIRAALLLTLAATPAAADPALFDFMGGQGCTFGDDSRQAAIAAGFSEATIDSAITTALANGTAKQERAYVVLNEATCTIRLPEITSRYTANSPEIKAITSAIDAYASEESPGCFLGEVNVTFDDINGGEVGAGYDDFFAFVGANLISGDLRFYETSPLRTPPGFQVMAGDCGNVAKAADIARSHEFLMSGFGTYIRRVGAEEICDGPPSELSYLSLPAELQGYDSDKAPEDQPAVNAWLFLEFQLISMAAGWYEGQTGTERGTPRPPLCHYAGGN